MHPLRILLYACKDLKSPVSKGWEDMPNYLMVSLRTNHHPSALILIAFGIAALCFLLSVHSLTRHFTVYSFLSLILFNTGHLPSVSVFSCSLQLRFTCSDYVWITFYCICYCNSTIGAQAHHRFCIFNQSNIYCDAERPLPLVLVQNIHLQ